MNKTFIELIDDEIEDLRDYIDLGREVGVAAAALLKAQGGVEALTRLKNMLESEDEE